eukprot:scaffold114510_cov27-Tisochrysis_lutea.AAC.2
MPTSFADEPTHRLPARVIQFAKTRPSHTALGVHGDLLLPRATSAELRYTCESHSDQLQAGSLNAPYVARFGSKRQALPEPVTNDGIRDMPCATAMRAWHICPAREALDKEMICRSKYDWAQSPSNEVRRHSAN